ncbi:hypothetical protein NL351_27465, partial [Klebsiella pneumoniae]|nr:hypothetical protein [Klebsiella pneumoniae]
GGIQPCTDQSLKMAFFLIHPAFLSTFEHTEKPSSAPRAAHGGWCQRGRYVVSVLRNSIIRNPQNA